MEPSDRDRSGIFSPEYLENRVLGGFPVYGSVTVSARGGAYELEFGVRGFRFNGFYSTVFIMSQDFVQNCCSMFLVEWKFAGRALRAP